MKTNYIKILLLTIGVSFISSCDDKLDINDPNNTGDVIALSNDKNVKTTLIGAYDGLSAGAFFGGNTLRNSELLAANDEVVFSGTFNDVSDLYRKEMITSNSDVTNLWTSAYNTINIANNVLSALAVVNAADRDQVQGEALFLRGISYFELIQFYAKPYSAGSISTNPGVPVLLVEDRNSTANFARETVETVYAQIISDLTTAESLLEEGPNPGKATKEAAAAFLSRVYLQAANYAGARDAANRAIGTGNYALVTTYAGCFNNSSTSEDLFDIPVSSVDGVNNMQTFYASSSNGGRGDIEVQTKHLNQYELTDDRLDLYYIDSGTGDTRVGKWVNRFGSVKVLRLAELYLTRAECNQRLGTSTGDTPLNDVNRIRGRVNLLPLVTVNLAAILLERRLELAHEGQRIHDAKRLKEAIQLGASSFAFDNDLLVFPIPQRERNVNPLLTQNTGYTD